MDDQIEHIEHQALSRLMQVCSQGEKCKSDLRYKLRQWKISEESAERIISQLEKENFVDESRFAQAFAKDKINFNKWGKNKVRYNLKMKEISENDIEDAFLDIDDMEYFSLIEKEIADKNRKTKAKSTWERKGKIVQFAQSRGYETEIVMELLDRIL